MAPENPPRRHHHRPLVGRSLWRASRLAARGYGVLRQVGRRLSDQHCHRHGAARPQGRRHHPRRRRADGPVHKRADGARRCRLSEFTTDPDGSPHSSFSIRRERQDLPPHLLSRQLRRQRADESEIDEAFIESAKAVLVSGPISRAPIRRPRSARRCGLPAPPGARWSSTSTTGRNSGALPGSVPARSVTSSPARSEAPSNRHPAAMRPHRRHRGGDVIAGGTDDPLEPLNAVRGREPGDPRAEARPDGLRGLPEAIPDAARSRGHGAGFPVEVYNVLGAGDAFMSGFLRGWLRGEPRDLGAYANAYGAFAVSRLLVLGRIPTWDELSRIPRAWLAASGATPGRDPQPHPLGDDTPPSRPR